VGDDQDPALRKLEEGMQNALDELVVWYGETETARSRRSSEIEQPAHVETEERLRPAPSLLENLQDRGVRGLAGCQPECDVDSQTMTLRREGGSHNASHHGQALRIPCPGHRGSTKNSPRPASRSGASEGAIGLGQQHQHLSEGQGKRLRRRDRVVAPASVEVGEAIPPGEVQDRVHITHISDQWVNGTDPQPSCPESSSQVFGPMETTRIAAAHEMDTATWSLDLETRLPHAPTVVEEKGLHARGSVVSDAFQRGDSQSAHAQVSRVERSPEQADAYRTLRLHDRCNGLPGGDPGHGW